MESLTETEQEAIEDYKVAIRYGLFYDACIIAKRLKKELVETIDLEAYDEAMKRNPYSAYVIASNLLGEDKQRLANVLYHEKSGAFLEEIILSNGKKLRVYINFT